MLTLRGYDDEYGYATVQTFRDEVGRLIVYKSKAPSNYSIGERVRVTATVKERWSRLSEQIFRIDKWSLCRGQAAKRSGSGVK